EVFFVWQVPGDFCCEPQPRRARTNCRTRSVPAVQKRTAWTTSEAVQKRGYRGSHALIVLPVILCVYQTVVRLVQFYDNRLVNDPTALQRQLGKNIRKLRMGLGISQAALAERSEL